MSKTYTALTDLPKINVIKGQVVAADADPELVARYLRRGQLSVEENKNVPSVQDAADVQPREKVKRGRRVKR